MTAHKLENIFRPYTRAPLHQHTTILPNVPESPVSEMAYTVSSGMLNSSIPYQYQYPRVKRVYYREE